MFRKKLFPVASIAAVALAVPTMATASSPTLELSVPVADCAAGDWIQVTTPDGAGDYSLDGDTLTIVSGLIGDGVDHRFTVQTNQPVDGCHVTDPGVLSLDGDVLDPYQRDLAPGGANLQVTWRSEEATEPEPDPGDGDDSIPWTELEPAEPIDGDDQDGSDDDGGSDDGDGSTPWTDLEPAEPVDDGASDDGNDTGKPSEEPSDTTTGQSTSEDTTHETREKEASKQTPKTLDTDAAPAQAVTANPRMAG